MTQPTAKSKIEDWIRRQPPGHEFTVAEVWEHLLGGAATKKQVRWALAGLVRAGVLGRRRNPRKGKGKADTFFREDNEQ